MRRWRRAVLPVVLTLLLIVLLGTVAALVHDRSRETPAAALVRPADLGASLSADSDPVALEAAMVARLAATTYFTLAPDTVEDDMDAMRALGTTNFVASYDKFVAGLAQRVRRRDLTLTASVPLDGVATEYLTADLAQVLVAVDVATTRGEVSRTSAYRTRVTLKRLDGSWRVAALDEVT